MPRKFQSGHSCCGSHLWMLRSGKSATDLQRTLTIAAHRLNLDLAPNESVVLSFLTVSTIFFVPIVFPGFLGVPAAQPVIVGNHDRACSCYPRLGQLGHLQFWSPE
ncbi:hypothetical protein N658DRAFT_491935 [Parathielavia hyrcaniae]|uniref:Uncharacterized protein n=1 Tax=Parathielavia hyrcaniae TaxID=113614 RepID=A0AAN6T5Y7_9PEZI|nr:hypothetical protein N658DRAFT_491935 [Parathielavia hyrcaniae]